MNGHSFLFKEGKWKAAGVYTDADGISNHAHGKVIIKHTAGLWVSDGTMYVKGLIDAEIKNNYEIIPFRDGKDFTTWKSVNPVFGLLTGRLMVIADSILSMYSSEDGIITGFESLLQINSRLYRNWGFVFKGKDKLSSWAMDLEKLDL
ncbi:MAG: hypothetical protein AB7T22_11575 [Calditrichaceae bacterium]